MILLGYITHTLGVVSHSVYIVKIVSLRQGALSHWPHNSGQIETTKKLFHLLKTSTKCLGSTKTACCLLKNAYIYINTYIYISYKINIRESLQLCITTI